MTKDQILISVGLVIAIVILFLANPFLHENKQKPKGKVLGVSTKIDDNDLSNIIKPPLQIKNTEPNIQARYAILIDRDTAKVMYDKKANEKVPIASTTKLISAAIILEEMDLSKEITVKRETALVPGSIMGLKSGEKITIGKLLEGMLIVSGNDAARTIADAYGNGNIEKFVQKMNEKAKELGMSNSNFKDPAGYEDEGYSTARDLATIAAYDLKFDKFKEIVTKVEYDLYSDDNMVKHHLKNSNRLVIPAEPLYFSGAIGLKTGFTNGAGHCLVSAATRDGHTLIAVVLNTNSTTPEASARVSREILSWGFSNWSWEN